MTKSFSLHLRQLQHYQHPTVSNWRRILLRLPRVPHQQQKLRITNLFLPKAVSISNVLSLRFSLSYLLNSSTRSRRNYTFESALSIYGTLESAIPTATSVQVVLMHAQAKLLTIKSIHALPQSYIPHEKPTASV